ncbi:MAG: SRPBCC domain-containing protein [Lysobacterales bacterium]|jgi:hypothetical protein
MKIEKCFVIDAPQETVWDFISSPEKVGPCFPGCKGVKKLGDNQYQTEIKVQIGPIKTVFNIEFEETESRPMEYFAYASRGEEGHRASRLKADSTLTLSPLDGGKTQVDYASELSIVGRLGKFGLGMMKKKADTMGDEFIAAVRSEIEGPAAGSGAAEAETDESAAPAADGGRPGGLKMAVAAAVAAVILLLVYYFTR